MATEKVTHDHAELFGVAFGMAFKTFLGCDQRKKENATCEDVSNQDVSNKQANEKKAQPVRGEEEEEAGVEKQNNSSGGKPDKAAEGENQEEEEAEEVFWVQCNGCDKWRALAKAMQKRVEAEEEWYCTMTKDLTCAHVQQPFDEGGICSLFVCLVNSALVQPREHAC
jgi:hypothetical protein